MKSAPLSLTSLVLLLVAGAVDVDGQVRRGRDSGETARWAPIAIGIRGGWDQRANAEALGAQLRLPIVRSGIVELAPSADVVFLQGAKDYQYSLEMAWLPAGAARGGVFLTGGVGWRDTPIGTELPDERTTYFGYVLGAGGKTRVGPLEIELGLRWTFLNDTNYRPNLASFGVNLPVWSVRPEA